MNTVIFGSGFGLYGYLPAIYSSSKKIFLNDKYKKVFFKRKELSKFKKKIVWYSNFSKIQNSINYAVIAKRPNDQTLILKKVLSKKKRIKHVFLEKPINVNPKKSFETIKLLTNKKINYSFGFLFDYLNWYKILKNKNIKKKRIEIIWHIKKNKKNNEWKYNDKIGGGILRYYGIHLIRLAFSLRYLVVNKNFVKKNSWSSDLKSKKNHKLSIRLKFSKKNKFSILVNGKKKYESTNPFLKSISTKKIDPRTFILKKYINSNLLRYKNNCSDDLKFVKFWKLIENTKTLS